MKNDGSSASQSRGAGGDRPAPEQFPVTAFPSKVAEFISAAATAIGCHPSYIALPLLACLARAIGNKRSIRLKHGWTELAIIWAAIVGKSGTHKSPAISLARQRLDEKQAEANAKHVEALAQYEQDLSIYQRDHAAWKRSKGDEPPPWEPAEPKCPRFIVSDITIEALADRLDGQFDGVVLVRDELAGWINGFAEYKGGKGSDTGHWLALWSGLPFTVDRKGGDKKTIHIPRGSASIVGGIQPGILRKAIGREHQQDGLCARFLLSMPERQEIEWTENTVSPEVEKSMAAVFDKLLALETTADEQGNDAPWAMTLTPEAKALWVTFYNRNRQEMKDLDDDLTAAWSKLEAYAARLAMIMQLCSWASGEVGSSDLHVDETSMRAGIELADWFGGQSRLVYAVLAENDEQREDRELLELVGRKGGQISIRQLAHACTRYRAPGEAEKALERLARAKLGRWDADTTTGGRPANYFVLYQSRNVTHENNGKTGVTLLPTGDGGSYGG